MNPMTLAEFKKKTFIEIFEAPFILNHPLQKKNYIIVLKLSRNMQNTTMLI